jgi:hypothetical protein
LDFRECAAIDRVLESNLEVLGRSLAAIGNFFVFHRLSFIKGRKASFLNRRNMNKNVFAAARGLDESKPLGRVEPLHSAFSHHVVSAGAKNKKRTPGPRKPACPTDAGYAVWGALDSLNDSGISAKIDRYRGSFAAFCLFRDDLAKQKPGNPPVYRLASRQALGMPLAPFAMSSFNLAVKFQREARMTE